MLLPDSPAILGWGAFSIFAVLAGLVLLNGADHAAPGCTGPEVQRCDYVETAKAALDDRSHVQPDLGFEIVTQARQFACSKFCLEALQHCSKGLPF